MEISNRPNLQVRGEWLELGLFRGLNFSVKKEVREFHFRNGAIVSEKIIVLNEKVFKGSGDPKVFLF